LPSCDTASRYGGDVTASVAAVRPAWTTPSSRAAPYADFPRPQKPAISRLAIDGAQALIVFASPLFNNERRRIVTLALAHHRFASETSE
jgi:hypothetical protein